MIQDRETITVGPSFRVSDAENGGSTYTVTINGQGSIVVTDGTNSYRANEKTFYYRYQDKYWKIQDMSKTEDGEIRLRLAPTSVTVPAGEYGTLIKVYYDLKQYPYTVNHWIELPDGGEELIETDTNTAPFQSQVKGDSLTRQQLIQAGYVGYRMDKDEKQITITRNIQDDSQNPTINVINFYYYEVDMVFNYQPMVVTRLKEDGTWETVAELDDPNGHVSVESETVKAKSTVKASLSTAIWKSEAYDFKGWYLDESCTVPADGTTGPWTVTGKTIEPKKITEIEYWNDETGREETWTQEGFPGIFAGDYVQAEHKYAEEKTFYALFQPKMGNLTIKREEQGPDCGHNEANSFVYKIEGTSTLDEKIAMYVTIDPGQTSVTVSNLPFGTYAITQENSWSWRYGDGEQTVTINDATPYPEAVFNQQIEKKTWLSGFAEAVKNTFRGA